MANKREVIDAHLAHPSWGPSEIADHLSCDAGYVRATARRCAIKLPRSMGRGGRPKIETITQLGIACRKAGLTLADLQDITETIDS